MCVKAKGGTTTEREILGLDSRESECICCSCEFKAWPRDPTRSHSAGASGRTFAAHFPSVEMTAGIYVFMYVCNRLYIYMLDSLRFVLTRAAFAQRFCAVCYRVVNVTYVQRSLVGTMKRTSTFEASSPLGHDVVEVPRQ